MELEVAVLLILAGPRQEAVEVSILRFLLWPGLLTHTIPDPIILSDDESAGAESETDCSDLDLNVDVRAKSDSDPPHVADSELADGDGFGLGAALISNRLVTDHQDDDNDHNGVIDKTQLRLSADRPRPASPDPGSDTHQASKLQVNTDIIQESTSYDNLDVTKELEGEGFDVFAEGDDVDSRSTKGRRLSAVSDKNPASGSNISGLQDGQPDDTQSPQLALAGASPHQSDLKNDHLPKQLRRGATRNGRRKRPRAIAPIRLATTASTASTAPEFADLEEPKSRVQITAPDEEWELCDTDQKMVDDGSTDDSDDEDYADMSDAAGSKRGRLPHSRKRVRRTKDREHNDVEGPPTYPVDVLCQAAAATSSSSTQESEEMPIHKYFTLKTVASKVVYCLTFSQELLPRPQHQGQRQDSTPDLEKPQSVALDSRMCQAPLQRQTTRRPWTREEDATLGKMKKKGHSWAEIHAALPQANRTKVSTRVKKTQSAPPSRNKRTPFTLKEDALLVDLKENKRWRWKQIEQKFPQRTLNSLQVHYCTKLKGTVLTERDESV
jgi:hypothetical protein